MKLHNLSIVSFLFLGLFIHVESKAQWEKIAYDKQGFHRIVNPTLLKSSFTEQEGSNEWDLVYNKLELSIDPSMDYIKGKVQFVFKSLSENLSGVTINLDDPLKINSIKKEGKTLKFLRNSGNVSIKLDRILNKNEIDSFTVSYEGIPTSTGLGSFTQELHNDIPVIYTLSEPYGAKEWWPCKESLLDKIDSIDMLITTPTRYRSASNGVLVEDLISGGERLCHWKHRHPIATYLVFFSSTQYEVYSDWATLQDGKKVEILNYIYPETLESAKLLTPKTIDYLEYFSQLFIDYPFSDEKYGHAQFGWGGGMEHQTMSSMVDFFPDLISHELAHQWFGDYITCGSWNEIWLNEGFAEYLEGEVYEKTDPDIWQLKKENWVMSITSSPYGSVYVNDISDIDRIFDYRLTYEKGAFVLHMLRGQIGDEAFYRGVKNYLTDPRCINGFATTDILRENMEKAADTTLTEFFNDWIWGEGFPLYDFKWSYSDKKITINLSQQPSAPNGPFFEMKVPVTIITNQEEKTVWLANTEEKQQFVIALDTPPDTVIFDKDLWLLGKHADLSTSVQTLVSPKIKVLYNPADRYITTIVPETDKANYIIYDLKGRMMKSGNWEKRSPTLFVGKLPPGVYLLTFITENSKFTTRFACY